MSPYRSIIFAILAAILAGCASRAPLVDADPGVHPHQQELPPLRLTAGQEQLLASTSSPPRTALDYYLLLPQSYFSIMPDSRERRVTYIDPKTLSDDYLHAEQWFDCDGGGFEVILRRYKSSSGTIVGLLTGYSTRIYTGKPGKPDPSISVRKPSFWRYTAGAWVPVTGTMLPGIDSAEILDRYYHHYKAHLHYRDQSKSIDLEYTLLPTTTDIHLTGRENFMDPFKTYVWKRYRWTGQRFLPR